jgi:hypothetical protein
MFCTFTLVHSEVCAVPIMAVFCSSLILYFLSLFQSYFLNDFGMVLVAPVVTGILFVFTFNMRCIYNVRSSYFRILSAFLKSNFSLLKLQQLLTYKFLLHYHDYYVQFTVRNGSVRLHLLVAQYGYLTFMTCFTNFGTLYNFTPIFLLMLTCSRSHTLLCLFVYRSFSIVGQADVICSTASSNC